MHISELDVLCLIGKIVLEKWLENNIADCKFIKQKPEKRWFNVQTLFFFVTGGE